jgi:hypothetical protein
VVRGHWRGLGGVWSGVALEQSVVCGINCSAGDSSDAPGAAMQRGLQMTLVGAFLLAWMVGYVLGWKVAMIRRTLYAA